MKYSGAMHKLGRLLWFVLLAYMLSISMLTAQKLDYTKHVSLDWEGQTLHLYGDAEHTNDYYLVPFSGLFQLGKQMDGTPEFLFQRYTTDDRTATGALFHCLVAWRADAGLMAGVGQKLTKNVPGAVLKGMTPLGDESKFYIVSGSANDKKLVVTGNAPVLPGSKVAVALKMDQLAAQLMHEQMKQGPNADLSLVFEYKIPFQKTGAAEPLTLNWAKYRARYAGFSAILHNSIQPEQDAFAYLLKEGVVSFSGDVAPDAPTYLYARPFVLKYLKDVKPDDARANRQETQRLDMAAVQSDFALPLQISLNAGIWYAEVKDNPKCISSVNLNDPFFQSRKISVLLDFEAERIFKENGANFVTVTVKKTRENANPFIESVIFDRASSKDALLKEISYAKGNSTQASDYQYKIEWGLRDGAVFPKVADWAQSTGSVITILSPAKAVDIVVDASDEKLKHPQLRSVVLEITYNYFGTTKTEYVSLVSKENGPGIATKTFFCDKEKPDIHYRFIFRHKEKGKIETSSFMPDGENYFVPELPAEFNNTTPASSILAPPVVTGIQTAANPAKPIQRNNKDYALFFAVSDYQADATYPDLQNPLKDAQALAQELAQRYGFRTELLENPTRTQIKGKIEEYAKKFETREFDPEGQLLIFFSGHGEFAEGNGFFLPADVQPGDLEASAIAYPIWRSRIDNIACKHLLVVIDACYSGTFDQSVAMRGGPMKRPGELSDVEKFYQEHLARATRLFLASGGKEQTPDKSDFAKKLLEGLRVAETPFNILTAGQLFELYVKQIRPVPLFGEFGKDEAGSSFIFVKR